MDLTKIIENLDEKRNYILNCICNHLEQNEEGEFIINNMEIENNHEIKQFIVEKNKWLVKLFPEKNWSNIRKAKKRNLQTIKHLLKVMKIDLSRNVRYCIRLDDNNKRLESTYQMYRFKN
tara:strand:+ start:1568 stop:1927 length:360 start_codon:yes stop_codon:yes gene_type:complete